MPEVTGPAFRDPMDARPLRYRPSPDDEGFLLYSVGTDGEDDGGNAGAEGGREPATTPFAGKDWVWPIVARGAR